MALLLSLEKFQEIRLAIKEALTAMGLDDNLTESEIREVELNSIFASSDNPEIVAYKEILEIQENIDFLENKLGINKGEALDKLIESVSATGTKEILDKLNEYKSGFLSIKV